MCIYLFLAALFLSCDMRDFFFLVHGLLSKTVAHGFSCPEAYGILVPGPGVKPASPALEGGFLTTGPPGKPHQQLLLITVNSVRLRRSWGFGVSIFELFYFIEVSFT